MAKKNPKASDLPETIYVRYEPMVGSESAYFVAYRNAEDHADMNEEVEIGEYRLVRLAKVRNESTVIPK